MKRILYILFLLCFISAVSCTQELGGDDISIGLEPGTITLTLRNVEPQTKATMPGEAAYNENLIKRVHCFFYPKDGKLKGKRKAAGVSVDTVNLKTLCEVQLSRYVFRDAAKKWRRTSRST